MHLVQTRLVAVQRHRHEINKTKLKYISCA